MRAKTIKGKNVNGPMLVQLAQSYIKALNDGEVPTIDLAWDNVQVAELQRSFDEAMQTFNQTLMRETEKLPISEEAMAKIIQALKDKALSTFKSGILSGSDFLNTPKGEEFCARLQREQSVLVQQAQLKNRKLLSKELFDAIQSKVDLEIKPKINAMLQQRASSGEQDSPSDPIVDKYELRDLKRDLESIQEEFCATYPSELVFQKLFDVSFQMSELLSFVTKQSNKHAELYSKERLKRLEAEYAELKKELGDDLSRAQNTRHEIETKLIKSEA